MLTQAQVYSLPALVLGLISAWPLLKTLNEQFGLANT